MSGSDFLFARPSFVEGMARSIDLFGVLQEYNKSPSENAADSKALYHDFKAVGNDIARAVEIVGSEINK
jgi:hypothetical protein